MSDLPPELIQTVAGYLYWPLRLALANKHYYHSVTPILYEQIYLMNKPNTLALYKTLLDGPSHFRNYLKTLHIYRHYITSDDEVEELALVAKDLLMLIPNLVDLSLGFSQDLIHRVLAKETYPFRLRRLGLCGISGEVLNTLIRTQTRIEVLDLLEPRHSNEEPLPQAFSPLAADNLSVLKSVHTIFANIHHLILDRPVSSVEIWDSIKQNDIVSFIGTLKTSTVPLVALRIGLTCNPSHWHTVIPAFISSIKFTQGSLQNLTLSFGSEDCDFMMNLEDWLQ
ncbi:hypothetical protein FRC07_002817, partial [Ceratobasidium sp. 392]